MCIYCGTNKYRKIYENHVGPIPKEENGRSYEIHHIDGNHNNNDPANLTAVTIDEHYRIHAAQGDKAACLIISGRNNISPAEKSALASDLAAERIKNGTWHFTSENCKSYQKKLVEEGTHHLLTGQVQTAANKTRVENGTHNLLGSNNPVHKKVEEGTHHWLGEKSNLKRLSEGRHPSQIKVSCIYCKETVSKPNFVKHHGDNCALVKITVKQRKPGYVNSRAKSWKITNTLTGETLHVVGLKTWATNNGFSPGTVDWAYRKHGKFKNYIIQSA